MSKIVKIGLGIGLIALGALTGGVLLLPGTALAFAVSSSALIAIGLSVVASTLLTPTFNTSPGERQASETTLQLGELARQVAFGKVATAGSLNDAFNYGGDDNTDWEVLVIALADHECESLEGFYVNEDYVAYTGDGAVSGYSGQLEVYFLPGTETQAMPSVVTTHGSGWTASDNCAGVAMAVVAYKADDPEAQNPVWPGGRPRFLWVIKGKKCYIPSKDSTVAGGSGTHRYDNPSTWEWTDNAAECRYQFQRGIYALDRVDQPDQLLLGRGLSTIEAPPERVIAAAAVCDEDVPLKGGGTEKRYRFNGIIGADEDFLTAESYFAEAMGGIILQPEGSIEVEPGQPKATSAEITDLDILNLEEVQVEYFRGEADTQWVNTVTARYVEPSQKWKMHSAPIRRAYADLIEDGGPRQTSPEFKPVTSGTQAQRLGEIKRRLGRLNTTGSLTLGPRFCELEEGDWIGWTSARHFQGARRVFRIESYTRDQGWRMKLTLREISASVFDWTAATDQYDPLADNTQQSAPPALIAPGAGAWAATGGQVEGVSGLVPAIMLSGAVDAPFAEQVRIEYRRSGEAEWLLHGDFGRGLTQTVVTGLGGGSDYEVAVSNIVNNEPSPRRVLNAVTVAPAAFPDGSALAPPQLGLNVRDEAGDLLFDPQVITLEGISAGFTGQGALATRNTANFYTDVSNAPQSLTNLINKGDFSDGSKGTWLNGTVYQPSGLPAYKALLFGETNGGSNVNNEQTPGGTGALRRPINGGQTIFVSGWAYYPGPSSLNFGAQFYDKDGNSLGVVDSAQDFASASWGYFKSTITVPAGAASFYARPRIKSTAAGYGNAAFANLEYSVFEAGATIGARLGTGGNLLREDGTTRLTDAATVTNLGTAAAITGQSAWATSTIPTARLNNLSDTGNLSSLANISTRNLSQLNSRAWTNLFRANGTTAITDADAITNLGTAAAITGQGAFATVNSAAYGSALLTGFGTLAPRSNVRFGTEVVRANGSTVVADSDAITALGTAAAISNQGPGATAPARDVLNYKQENSTTFIPAPEGATAILATTTSATGAIRIDLPVLWTNNMMRFQVEIYDYASNASVSYLVGGYNYTGSGAGGFWVNPFAQMIGRATRSKTVRFGSFNGKACIWIGDPTDTWSHPTVRVINFFTRGSVYSTFSAGWGLSLDTATAGNPNGAGSGLAIANPSAADAVFGSNTFETVGGTIATLSNFRTNLGTATAIANQSAWATSNIPTTRLNNLSDTGVLSSLANVASRDLSLLTARAWTNLFRANGSTPITDADAITNLGTAAAITGQGTGATANNLGQLNVAEGAKLNGIEAGADVTATAQRTIEPQYPVIEIKQGEAGHTGSRTVTHVAKRGTSTLTGGTWSLPSTNLGAGTATISSATGTVTLSGIAISGAYVVRYVHSDGVVTELAVSVTYVPTPPTATVSAKTGTASSSTGVPNTNSWVQVVSLTMSNCPAGRLFFNQFGLGQGCKISILTGSGTCSHAAQLKVNGVIVASVPGQPSVSGGAIEFFDVGSLFGNAHDVPAGPVTVTVELQRTSGSGTIDSMNNKLDCNVIAS